MNQADLCQVFVTVTESRLAQMFEDQAMKGGRWQGGPGGISILIRRYLSLGGEGTQL